MISKSRMGALAFIAAIGLASIGLGSPAFAANYSEGANGGGSAGYNHHIATDYRLKHHHVKQHPASKSQ
jgi:hypothetical protein